MYQNHFLKFNKFHQHINLQKYLEPKPLGPRFDLQRSTKGKTEAEREAEFQRPGNWRWDQNAGYNPGDLEEAQN